MTRRSWLVYGLLLATLGLILAWQMAEHNRVRRSERIALVNRAKDISYTLGLVLRTAQRPFLTRERTESALNELIKSDDLHAVALLNAMGEVVAAAGAPIDFQTRGVVREGEHWGSESVTLVNFVDLGTNLTHDAADPALIFPRQDLTNRPPRPPPPVGSAEPDGVERPRRSRGPPPDWSSRTNERPAGFGRPFWMSEADYKSMREKRGVHSFVIVISTEPFLAACQRDLWMRMVIAALSIISVVGFGLAWRNLAKSGELQIRLVRASELNSHLKEMNLAAAGLAHETRNPLNIIRGVAQLISKQESTSGEVRKKARDIIDETDRVTAQLNEFINYSRPREVRPAPVDLQATVKDVVQALNYDIGEKQITVRVMAEPLWIEADEQLLRQALFNLLLNAVQAVDANGEIQIHASKAPGAEAVVEVRDNGPGVPAEDRLEIFKPYFTTHQQGTGLGLAVVQQIVLAHGWEIECASNEPRGAVFRISHLKPTTK
jgi:signal transduction histidine kinase